MGHRALVAYQRPTGGFTVRYSHWGARGYRLLESVTAKTPLGRVDEASNGTVDQLGGPLDDVEPDCASDVTPVRPEPLGVATDLCDVAASFVDPLLHEAAFVVDDSYRVRAFEPLAFWSGTPTEVRGGALVELRRDRDPGRDAAELRAWRRGATTMCLDAVAATACQDQSTSSEDRDVASEDEDATSEDGDSGSEDGDSGSENGESTSDHEALVAALREEAGDRDVYPIPPEASAKAGGSADHS